MNNKICCNINGQSKEAESFDWCRGTSLTCPGLCLPPWPGQQSAGGQLVRSPLASPCLPPAVLSSGRLGPLWPPAGQWAAVELRCASLIFRAV